MKKLALVSMIGLVLAGCGGGSDDNGGQPQQPKTVIGTVEHAAGNRIVVNGDDYTVNSVDYAGRSNVLPVGSLTNMMVKFTDTDSPTVNVQLEPTMIGVVSSEVVGNSFEVNGIALTFDGLTGISKGDWVVVSSLPTVTEGYKVLSVVKIEADKFDNTIELEGPIVNLDENFKTFKLGASLTINYIDAEDVDTKLVDGLWVEVTGKMNAAGTEIEAVEVEANDDNDLGSDAEVEGIVTAVNNSESYFEVNYRSRFNFDRTTEVELANDHKGSVDDIKFGLQVEVESILKNGQRFATDVEFDENDANEWLTFEKVGQAVEGVDANSFDLGGVTIFTDSKTRYEDGLTFDSLTQVGVIEVEYVEINNQYVAREIELED